MDFKRLEGETDEQLIYRVCSNKDSIGTWQEIADILNEILDVKYNESTYRKKFQDFHKLMEANQNKFADFAQYQKEVEDLKFELLTERKKLQRINREYHENARIQADHELYVEMVREAIEKQKPIKIIPTDRTFKPIKKIGLLVVSDSHYGKEILLKGLNGKTINEYSPEIYKQRMWQLMSDFENDFYKNPVDKIVVDDLGDCIEGILRLGDSIQKLRTGVIDSALEYAQFMSVWICELYNRLQVPIEYNLIGGNHDIIRILQQKASFDGENVCKTIHAYISQAIEINKLKNAQVGKVIDISITPYSDIIYNDLFGMNIFCYHGETKNMVEDINFFENYYRINIDILIGGHLHSESGKTIGVASMGDREIIRVPSIVGVDNFSKTIRKNARAGVKYIIFTENGKDWEKVYYLN